MSAAARTERRRRPCSAGGARPLFTPFLPPASQGYGQYEGKKLANRPTRLRHEVRPRSAPPPRHPTGVPARVVPKSMAMAYQKIGGPHAFR